MCSNVNKGARTFSIYCRTFSVPFPYSCVRFPLDLCTWAIIQVSKTLEKANSPKSVGIMPGHISTGFFFPAAKSFFVRFLFFGVFFFLGGIFANLFLVVFRMLFPRWWFACWLFCASCHSKVKNIFKIFFVKTFLQSKSLKTLLIFRFAFTWCAFG